jgi:hypothetical protein
MTPSLDRAIILRELGITDESLVRRPFHADEVRAVYCAAMGGSWREYRVPDVPAAELRRELCNKYHRHRDYERKLRRIPRTPLWNIRSEIRRQEH